MAGQNWQNIKYIVILMLSSHYALRAEKVLEKAGIACKLIPVPRHLSSECGICIRVPRAHCEKVFVELRAANIDIVGFHDI